jgi:hypothetical protein
MDKRRAGKRESKREREIMEENKRLELRIDLGGQSIPRLAFHRNTRVAVDTPLFSTSTLPCQPCQPRPESFLDSQVFDIGGL